MRTTQETAPLLDLEGTWEEIQARAPEFAGRRVRLLVLGTEPETKPADEARLTPEPSAAFRPASGRSVLRHADTWVGDDLEECLKDVYANRSRAKL